MHVNKRDNQTRKTIPYIVYVKYSEKHALETRFISLSLEASTFDTSDISQGNK